MTSYTMHNIINPGDPTFNQALGINDQGEIVGYFGSGAAGHPNKGWDTNIANLHAFRMQNFPTSVQTQVIGINDFDRTVGFWAPTDMGVGLDENFGFWSRRLKREQHSVQDPNTSGTPPTNNLLGINNHGEAVGFYNLANGTNAGYEFNTVTGRFSAPIIVLNASTTVSSIDAAGDIGGFYANGQTNGFSSFIRMKNGTEITGIVDGPAVSTQILGFNENGTEAVGDYTLANGNQFGFTYDLQTHQFLSSIGIGAGNMTTLNGVNDAGDIVGFYVNGHGNTIGLLLTPNAAPNEVAFNDAYNLLSPHSGMISTIPEHPVLTEASTQTLVHPA